MSAKQEKQEALNALKSMSMRKLRAHEAFWGSEDSRRAKIDSKPVLLWVMEQAAAFRQSHDQKMRLRALSVINWLLDNGHDPNQMHGSNSILMDAAILGDVAVARRLLHAGADIGKKSAMGNTALHWAAMAGCPAMCKFLLSQGSDLGAFNHNRQTPLHCAADRLRMNTISVLHEAEASWDPRDVHDRTPLEVLALRDPGLAKFWANKPERDRLARSTEASMSASPSSRSRRL